MEKLIAIDFSIVPVSNCPESSVEAKPIRVDTRIAIRLFHLLESLAPVMKRIINGAIAPISPENHCGSMFIKHLPD